MSVAAPVELRCPSCGTRREFSPEHVHRIRSGKAPLTPCRDCRRSHPKPTEGDRRWWLERFTIEEIRELAEALYPRG